MNLAKLSFLSRFELPLFIGVVLLHVVAIATLPAIISLDGAGHLYTARLLNAIMHQEEWTTPYFVFNTFPCPNGLADYLLSFFVNTTNAVRLEVYFMVVYFLVFIFGFRRMMQAMFPEKKEYAWLAFPLVFHVVVILGFHNFNLGIALLWWTIAAYVRYAKNPRWKAIPQLLIFCVLLYFSHLVVFGVFGFFVIAHFIGSWWQQKRAPWFWKKKVIAQLAFAFIPVMALALAYFQYETESSGFVHLAVGDIVKQLYSTTPFELFSHKEASYFYQTIGIIALAVVASIFWKKEKENLSPWLIVTLVFTALVLIATFRLPDHSTGGGELTRRLVYFSLVGIILVLFFAIQSRVWRVVAVVLFSIVHIAHAQFLFLQEKKHAANIGELEKMTALIAPHELMWTFNWSGNWLNTHTSKYIAADRELIMPDHLGGTKLYTPVMWNENYRLNQNVWCLNFEQWLCDLENTEQDFHRPVRYFLAYGQCDQQSTGTDKCEAWTLFFNQSCSLIAQSENGYIRLYERK